MSGTRTVRPVGGQESTQEIDKFVIDDDDMDSDTAAESNLSLRSRSFLMLDRSPEDSMQDIDKRSMIW